MNECRRFALVLQVILDLCIFDQGFSLFEQSNLFRSDASHHHFVVPDKKDGIGKTDESGAGNGNFQLFLP